MKRSGLLLVPALLLVTGCTHGRGSFSGGRYTDHEIEYVVGELDGRWVRSSRQPADVSFTRPDLGATIYVDNSCRRYRDASLNVLANHLFFGFDDVEVMSQELLEHDDREALRRVVRARLDGVPLRLGLTVVKKNNCIFDLVLIAPRETFADAHEDYLMFVDAFRVESCP